MDDVDIDVGDVDDIAAFWSEPVSEASSAVAGRARLCLCALVRLPMP